MIGLFVVTASCAGAWEPGSWSRIELSAPPDELALGVWAGEPVVLTRAGETLSAWQADGGGPRGEVAVPGARGMLLHDLDRDGSAELLVCAADGLRLVRPTLPLGGRVVALWSGDCRSLAAFDAEAGWPALVVATADGVARLDPSPEGLVPTVLASGEGAVAAGASRVVVWRGGEVLVFDGPARTSFSAPANLSRLAGGPAGVGWASTDGIGWVGEPAVALPGVASLAVDPAEARLWAGTADAVAVLEGGGITRFPTGGAVQRLAVGDLGAGCPAVAIASTELPRVAVAAGRCGEVAAAPPPSPVAAPAPGRTYDNQLPGVLAGVRCHLLAGWAYGAWDSAVDGSEAWSQVGDDNDSGPKVEDSFSAGAVCSGGRTAWRWALGVGTAAAVGFETRKPDLYVDLGAEVGEGRVVGGPIVQVGTLNWAALGGRVRFALAHGRHGRPIGTELRVVGVPGATAGVLGTFDLAYGLGRYRPPRREAW